MTSTEITKVNQPRSLVRTFADKVGVDPDKLLSTLKHTAFKQRGGKEVSNEQLMALLAVANKYELDPFVKQIYAFDDGNNGIIPVIGVDGWLKLINERPEFDGVEFINSERWHEAGALDKEGLPESKQHQTCPEEITCVIYRRDRSRPTKIPAALRECYVPPRGQNQYAGPWQSHTKRMLQHKALIQCARYAFNFAGIYDEDEAHRIRDAVIVEAQTEQASHHDALAKRLRIEGGGEEVVVTKVTEEGEVVDCEAGQVIDEVLDEAEKSGFDAICGAMPELTDEDVAEPPKEEWAPPETLPPESLHTVAPDAPLEAPEAEVVDKTPTVSDMVSRLAAAKTLDELEAVHNEVETLLPDLKKGQKSLLTSSYRARKTDLEEAMTGT